MKHWITAVLLALSLGCGADATSPVLGDDDDDGATTAEPTNTPEVTPTPQGVELNPGFIGGACSNASDCDSDAFTATPSCVTSGFPNGMCTQECTPGTNCSCPDEDLSPGSLFTATRPIVTDDGSPACASECDFDKSPTGCRPGYACVLRQRYNAPESIYPVCLPDDGQRWPGEPAPAFDVGEPCTKDSDCSNLACLAIQGGYCAKSMCDLAGCPSGSSCFEFNGGATYCLKDCTSSSQCRTGENYTCLAQEDACWPGPPPEWNASVGATDCADAFGALSPCDLTADDYVVVHKSARNLALCNMGSVVGNYHVGLGWSPIGDKNVEGDGKTPEGTFYIPYTISSSQYYKAFLVSYPDASDALRGYQAGLIGSATKTEIENAQSACGTPPQGTALGGLIEIHGEGGGQDWTWGCMALENNQIDALWSRLGARDTVIVKP